MSQPDFETSWQESRILGFFRAVVPAKPSLETSWIVRAIRKILSPIFRPLPLGEGSHRRQFSLFAWVQSLAIRAKSKGEGTTRPMNLMRALLAILLWACVFLPRISLGRLGGYYALDLKTEDLILFFSAIAFFIFPTTNHHPPSTVFVFRIESCFLLFLLMAGLSIVNGIGSGTLDKPLVSVLYLAKWFEYFLVFAFAARLTRTPEDAYFYLKHFFFLGLAVALYGYFEHFYPTGKAVYPNYYRLYERAPFHGDANHIGGLLAVWMAFFMGIYFRIKDRRWLPGLVLALLFVFFPLIWTFSRKSYFALAGAFAFAFFIPGVDRRRWLFLGCLLVYAGLLLPTRLAERLTDLGEVMTEIDPYHSSWSGNLDVWRKCLWNFQHFWVFGAGFGARHRLFYESQYIMTLTETGVAGFSAFLMLLLVPAVWAFQKARETSGQGLIAGAWLAAWMVLGIHNFSCVSLTVSKVAIPCWFLTGGTFVFLSTKEKTA